MKKLLINRWLKNYFFFLINLIILEVLFIFLDGATISKSIIRIILFNNILAILLSFFVSFSKDKLNKILIIILHFIFSFYSFMQLGFNNFLGVYASFNTSSQLGAVIDYIREFILSFKWTYYLIFIPFILNILFIFVIKKYNLKDDFKDIKRLQKIGTLLVLLLISCSLFYGSLRLKFLQNKYQMISNINLFKNPNPPTMAVRQLGIMAFGVSDIKTFIIPTVESRELLTYEKKKHEEEMNIKYARVIDDTIFKQIIKDEKDEEYNTLNEYFINQDITPKNDYTGLFEGKNVIVIMMESVNDIIINEKDYPNFYKLYSNGWHWKNNYSPRNSCATGNNELSGLISQYTIYNMCTANNYKNNKYFTSMFNLFNNKGYYTSSFHNYTEQYYSRATIHPNLGSQKYYGVESLKIPYSKEYRNWSSDVDLMNKYLETIDTYDKKVPFMSWITTVSSHQPYGVSSILGDKYYSMFNKNGYPSDLIRYMSKLKVLDNALGTLVEGLEKRGILDNTVIVLYGDHYPYAISKETINKVLNYDLNDYEVERVPFIIYNSKVEPKEYEEYTSYVNILPTLANLFNLDYDPRFYMGTDLLSKDYESKVVFADGSWKNDKVYYNASNGKLIKYQEDAYTEEEIINITSKVRNQIDVSNRVIKSNYFNYLENKFKEYQGKEETTTE